MPSYLTISDADTLAATLPAAMVSSYVAAASGAKTAALEEATLRIDSANRYQGRKYESDQVLEFPRVAYESNSAARGASGYPLDLALADTIWDWDEDEEEAVVPAQVKRACLLEANSIIAGTREGRMAAQHDGLASQSIGSASEGYRPPAGSGSPAVLCRNAWMLMEKYRLRSGQMR